jgi:pimeloyl-ACP methyl ester carboxylesterase
MLVVVASTLFVAVLALIGALPLNSPGRPAPFLDAAGEPSKGSVSEKIYVDINGIRQGMFIKGKDVTHPVLLYLHGGIPDYFLSRQYPTGLEDAFTVVWWEQRGSGISYAADIPPQTMTLEQLIDDAVAVTNYLRGRFHRQQVYLMGHSGGSFIGIQAAARAPQLYHACIGVAQMSYQLESERLAYEYMLQQFRANGNRSMVRKLEVAPVSLTDGTPPEYVAIRDNAMHVLGIGTMHEMHSLLTGLVIPSLLFTEYTLTEKPSLWRAKLVSPSSGAT